MFLLLMLAPENMQTDVLTLNERGETLQIKVLDKPRNVSLMWLYAVGTLLHPTN